MIRPNVMPIEAKMRDLFVLPTFDFSVATKMWKQRCAKDTSGMTVCLNFD